MSFLNPALLAGTLLFAVPLVIHLLNRQRHKKRPWAAMEFLLRAFQKQRNRLRNENLLLLLLRCLLPIVLALAIARPLLQKGAVLLGGTGLVHHVLVVDASYSMGLRQDGAPTPFERARTMVGQLLDRFEQNPQRNDKVTLVSAGVRPRFLTQADLDLAAARAGWLQLQKPDDAATDLGDALTQVADALEREAEPNVQVYVFSDLQARAFGDSLAATAGAVAAPNGRGGDAETHELLRDTVDRLAAREGLQLHWIDTGPWSGGGQGGVLDNVQLTGLRLADPVAVQKAPAEVVATLRNVGQATANCEVTLEVDGGEPMRKLVEVPAGAEGEAEFQLTFRTAGRHRLRAALVEDALAADDERFLCIEVRERVRVLLVDGADGGDPLKSYAYQWQAMLDPDASELPTYAVEVVDLIALLGGQVTPKNYDVVVLSDVERLDARAKKSIEDALRAGRGLLCQLGPRVDAASYNLHLHDAGLGPMPFRLFEPLGSAPGSGTSRTPSITQPDHPVLAEFDEEVYREILQAIPLWRWFGIDAASLQEHDDALTVLRVTDAEQTPLMVVRPFGDGKALFLTSAIGSEYDVARWNRLDDPLVAFPLLHGMVKWLALPAVDPFTALVGGTLCTSVAARPEQLEVQRPERDGRPPAPIADTPQAIPGERYLLPAFSDTRFAGFYQFDMTLERDAGREALSLPFAVNVEAAEGELRYPSHAEITAALGIERVIDALPAVREAEDSSNQNELGPSLLLLTLLLVLGEAALARYIAARRG